jgi:hypothetical protein
VSSTVGATASATMDWMTILQSRPILRVRRIADAPDRSPLIAAAIAAVWTAAAGLVTVLALSVAAWFAADKGSFGGAVRVGVLGWLVAQGGGLHVGEVEITAIPLGGCLVAALLLYRGGRWVGAASGVRSVVDAIRATAVMASTYAGIALIAYAVTRTDAAHADLVRCIVAAIVLAGGLGGLGILRAAGLSESLLAPVPGEARALLAGSVGGAFAMLAASGVAFCFALLLHFSDAVTLAESLHPGVVGGLILALVGLAAVPNGILCAGSYLAGPGFLLGTGTTVTAFSVQLGPLPAFPILAATPRTGGAWWQQALIVVPVLAGAVAGLIAVRRGGLDGYLRQAGLGGASGAIAGTIFGASTWLATGAIGPGRMQDIGPDALLTTLVCAVAFALGGAVTGAWWCWLDARRTAAGDRFSTRTADASAD